ncbi:MAG: carbon-nitrogen hydrolase family protein [Devosiaceae bacterium]|nr:carbon-nitrogen hydrolase family protein [Devosiaceae bacterium]
MSSNPKIAAIQLCSSLNVSDNLNSIDGLVKKAANAGATYILTPEMSLAYAGNLQQLEKIAKPYENNADIATCARIAKKYQIFLHIGSMAIKLENSQYANRSILFSPKGDIVDYYDKIHLFDANPPNEKPYRESDYYQGGNRAVIAKCDNFNIGFSICYDLRFASLFRKLAQGSTQNEKSQIKGAQIIAVPAAFTVPTGKAHWEILLRARAIETGSFIIAAAQSGEHENGRKTYGHSMIINPWGEIISSLKNEGEGFIVAEIILDEVQELRELIPAIYLQSKIM